MTRNTASAYGKNGIRCNIVLPGAMATNIATSIGEKFNAKGMETVQKLMGATGAEVCDIGHIGETCAFLCSDAAEVLNGAEIVADKGWTSF